MAKNCEHSGCSVMIQDSFRFCRKHQQQQTMFPTAPVKAVEPKSFPKAKPMARKNNYRKNIGASGCNGQLGRGLKLLAKQDHLRSDLKMENLIRLLEKDVIYVEERLDRRCPFISL